MKWRPSHPTINPTTARAVVNFRILPGDSISGVVEHVRATIDEHSLPDDKAFWTNHPECARRTWIEVVQNQPVEGLERRFQIELDIASLRD